MAQREIEGAVAWDSVAAYVRELREAPNGEPLNASDRLVLIMLAEHYRPRVGWATVSVGQLAQECALTRNGMRKILHRLVEKGFIQTAGRMQSNGERVPNVYRFLFLPRSGRVVGNSVTHLAQQERFA